MNKTEFKQTEIGEIPKGWDLRELGSLGHVVTGKTPPTKDADNFGEGYPFITPRDMTGQKYVRITERFLSEKGKGVVKNCLLSANSVCVSCIGSDMGKVVMTDRPSITNQQLNSIVCEHVDPHFVYYGILNIANRLRDTAFHSTAVPILNKSAFSRFQISIPTEYSEQRAIAKILSGLDNKIEINNQMNKTLESIAQAIFKRWFMDFEFPGYEKVKLVNGLPQGWRHGALGEIISIESGKRPGEKSETKTQGFTVPLIGASSVMGFVKDALYDEPILIIGRVGTHGVVQRVSWPSFPSDNTLVIRSKHFEFVYQILKTIDYEALNVGTTQPLITQTAINKYSVIIPANEVLEQFEVCVSGLFEKVVANNQESESLGKIRDSLLPRLMSGKIRVNA